MDKIADPLSFLEQHLPENLVDLFYSQAWLIPLLIVFVILSAVFVNVVYEALADSIKEKVKDWCKGRLSTLTLLLIVILAAAVALTSSSIISAAVLGLYGIYLLWGLKRRSPVRKWSLVIPLLSVSAIWPAELYIVSIPPKRVCIVLAVERNGLGGEEHTYQLWLKVASALQDALEGTSLHVYPNILTEGAYNSLSIEKQRTNIIRDLKKRGLYKALLVQNRAVITEEGDAGIISIEASLSHFDRDDLVAIGVPIVHTIPSKYVEYLSIVTAAGILQALSLREGYALTDAEKAHIRHSLLQRLKSTVLNFSNIKGAPPVPDPKEVEASEANELQFQKFLEEYEVSLSSRQDASRVELVRRSYAKKLALVR